ncbi:hypothetical protein ACFO4O_04240 [Glaciecola siphonariae]|uniref:Uncharacterized protein n=1 Tax=Glaciecola siphonariae TaxID=521012 RepID=A0ABV9LS86_9ALTE
MNRVIIGVDPDAQKHGVAVYRNKQLRELSTLTLVDIMKKIVAPAVEDESIELFFAIEDVCANTFIYSRNMKKNLSLQSRVARNVGACQQSQVELMRFLDDLKISYALYKPTSGNWAKNKKRFELLTGWNQRSNEDTRSAAYFGYLAAR